MSRSTGLLLGLVGSTLLSTSLLAQASTVVLVRHVEKADTSGDTDISPVGRLRAQALASALESFPLNAIYVSEYRRTLATASPAAERQKLVPVPVPVKKDPKSQAAAIAEAVRRLPAGSAALVVGHSNTLGRIVAALGGPPFADLCDSDYATLLVLDLSAPSSPRLIRTQYGPPNPPDTDGCRGSMRLP